MPCVYHKYERALRADKVLTESQLGDVADLSITRKETSADGDFGHVVVPARTWLARVPGEGWFLVPQDLKAALKAALQ